MARINIRIPSTHTTHEGATARRISPMQQLKRMVMANMLWEDQFYIDGQSTANLIAQTVPKVPPVDVANIARKARTEMKLRHVPLLLTREMVRASNDHRVLVAETLEYCVQRADELTEFMAIYWKDGRQKLAAQVKKGLARAFTKFSAYDIAKYNRDGAVKLRDVLFLTHPKPKSADQQETWNKLVNNTLAPPDTWEVALSGGADKKSTWERLLSENKLGALALLRNLRNMLQAQVPEGMIRSSLRNIRVERVLPFRFISAAKYAPRFEPELEAAMFKCLTGHPKLNGKTILLVDASGSMTSGVSGKSDITRYDAACGLAMLLREVCETVQIAKFSYAAQEVAPRRGFALRDVLGHPSGGTNTETAKKWADQQGYDRVIIITDEQSHQALSNPKTKLGYVINVAAYQNGVGYGAWHHIDGWSEAVIDYIQAVEKSGEL